MSTPGCRDGTSQSWFAELALLAVCGPTSGQARGTAGTLAKKSDKDAALRKSPLAR